MELQTEIYRALLVYKKHGIKVKYKSGKKTFIEKVNIVEKTIIESDKHILAYFSFRLVLRPMSDLIKFGFDKNTDRNTLLSNFFDVFYLLKYNGLATDINTIKD